MLALGPLAFASPWLLSALAGLPIVWWLLRVTPPAPRRIAFPAIRLLLGLVPREVTPARTPLWLVLLRMAIAALVIIGAAHPLLNPQPQLPGTGPLILIVDDGWAAAHDWPARQAALSELLTTAEREERQIILVTTAPPVGDMAPPALAPIRAADARAAIDALVPKPWPVDRRARSRVFRRRRCLKPMRRSRSATALPIAAPRRLPPGSTSAAAYSTSPRVPARHRRCSPPATATPRI